MEGLGMILGGGVAGMATNMIENLSNNNYEDRQRRFYNSTMRDQMNAQKEMTEWNNRQALEMWKKTGSKAQMEELKKAGLNPALMYGTSGGGGGTVSNNSASVEGKMPTLQQGSTIKGMEMGLNLESMKAGIELMKAQASKAEAEATKTAGVDTKSGELDVALKELQQTVKERTQNAEITTIEAESNQAIGKAKSMLTQGNIDEKTYRDQVTTIKETAIGSYLNNELTKAKVEFTQEQTEAIAKNLAINYQNMLINRRNANATEKNAEINLHKQIKDALYQNDILEQNDRKMNQELIMNIANLLGGKMPTTTTTTRETNSPNGTIYSTERINKR